jgi:hypothetical protein
MPQIETKNEKVKKLVGLHLYHDPLSSCAMRVRMVLAEKNLPWQNHVIDLHLLQWMERSTVKQPTTRGSRFMEITPFGLQTQVE